MMKYYDCVSQYDVDRFLEPFTEPTQPGPEKASALSPSSSRVIGLLIGLYKLFAKWADESVQTISYCMLLLLCSCFVPCYCFAHCCHDPIIMRTASHFSTFPRFHSVCASVSMFMINIDNCLFQFLCSCLRVCSLGATSLISSHQVSVCL